LLKLLLATKRGLVCGVFCWFACVSSAQTTGTAAAADRALRAGREAYARGELKTAETELSRAVKLTPGRAGAHIALGEVLLDEGQTQAAMAEFKAGLRVSRSPAETHAAYAGLGEVASQLCDYADAMTWFGKALAQPDAVALNARGMLRYATAQASTGEAAAARATIDSAVKQSPEDAALHDARGTLLAQTEDFAGAAQEFERAIQLQPTLASAHFHEGSVLLAAGHAEDAVRELTESQRLAPTDVSTLLQLGRALTATGRDEDAIATLRKAVAAQPASLEAAYELALALQAAGNSAEAVPLFQRMATAKPDDRAAHTNLGLALVQTGDAKGAIAEYTRALAIDPRNATLREDMGVAYLQQSDLDHALEQFRAGLTLEPGNAHLHYDLALALKQDESATVLGSSLGTLGTIRSRIATEADAEALNAVIRKQYGPVYAGLKPANKKDGYDLQQRRTELFGALGEAGDAAVLAHARQLAEDLFAGKKSTEADLVDVSVAIAAENGDEAFYERLLTVSQKSNDPGLQTEALQMLTRFRKPVLVIRTLEYAVSGQVRNQDSWILIATELSQPQTRELAWSWVQQHWDKVKAQLTTASGANVVGSTGSFCTVAQRAEVADFFATHKVEAAERTLAKALDSIDACVKVRETQEPKLREWLGKQGN